MLWLSKDPDKIRLKQQFKRLSAVNEETLGTAIGSAQLLTMAAVLLKWLYGKYPLVFGEMSVGVLFLALAVAFMWGHLSVIKTNVLKSYKFAIFVDGYQNRYAIWMFAFPVAILFGIIWFGFTFVALNKPIGRIIDETDFRMAEFTLLGLFGAPAIALNMACQALVPLRRRKRNNRVKAMSVTRP